MLLEHYLKYLQEESFLKTKVLQFLNWLRRKPAETGRTEWTPKEKSNLKKIRNLKLIDKFKIPKDETVIMGSAVLVLHGYLKRNDDIDLVVTRSTLNKMRTSKDFVKDRKFNKVFYRTPSGSVEAAMDLQIIHEKLDNRIRRSDIINNYRFMSLKDTHIMYEFLNRPKDVEKLRKLRAHFKG